MKLDPILTKACRLARSGKYEAAIRTLEPEVNRYHGSFSYYYLLGSSCLRTGDFGGALIYFRRANETKPRDPKAILGLATLYLRRGETDRAVDYYLEILELDHKNRIAKKAMKLLRKRAGTDSFSAWLEAGRLPSLYPPILFPGFSKKEVFSAFAVVAAVCAVTFGLLVQFKVIRNPLNPRGNRQGIASFTLSSDERKSPVQTGGSYRYILTSGQALETYERALTLFTAYRDEAARINLNRILESNASEGLKNKARIIFTYMEVPGFDSFKRGDNVSFTDVMKDPVLYRDVYVIWRGMATNVETADEKTAFDFLVGYDTKKTLEGIIPVTFNQALSLNPDRPLEVLGRVVPAGADTPIILEGLAIHQSGRLDN
ncbi:MAG: tetratricopeptide repeat protein [Treponema sp.]|nr:tetratricopeptide repeat protein [Treponema sp.]